MAVDSLLFMATCQNLPGVSSYPGQQATFVYNRLQFQYNF